MFGNLTAADWLCGQLAARAGGTVVSVGYRLAPEHPAPTPFSDSWSATQWLVEHAELLGGDRLRVTVMGESAGANLAALIALASRDLSRADPGWPPLARQILAYPAVDLTLSSASIAELADAPMLRRETLDWYGRLYLPQGRAHQHRRRRPAGEPDLRRRPHRAGPGAGPHRRRGPTARRRHPVRRGAGRGRCAGADPAVRRRPSTASCPSRCSSRPHTKPWRRSWTTSPARPGPCPDRRPACRPVPAR